MTSEAKNYTMLEGKYTVIGLDIDTTGRRLIDEIVHVAAYTPTDQFSQYIMPLMNLNPGARSRHQIRVITVGFFRMLKSMVDYKVIKTKTEIATIMEFLGWCEKINGENKGVIFVYHEQVKFVPYMMIEVMKKYNLSERFEKIVKGFVNGYELLDDEHKTNSLKFLSLTDNLVLQKKILNIELEKNDQEVCLEGNASRRANLSYEITKLMSYNGAMKELDDKALDEQMNEFIRSKALPLEAELEELVVKEESLTRQAGMRDIFIAYFSASRYHRRRAVSFRRALADANHDKETLQELWNTKKREGLEELVKSLEAIKEEDHEEFITILDSYFDEEKKPARPPTNPNAVNNRRDSTSNGGGRNYQNNNNNNNNKGGNNMRRNHSSRNIHQNSNNGNNGKENRGSRNNSRRRRPQRNNSNRRFSGNGNVGHEMNQKVYKDRQVNDNNAPQMTAVAN